MENVDPQPMDLVEPTKPPAPPAAQPETAAPESAKAPEPAKAEEPAKEAPAEEPEAPAGLAGHEAEALAKIGKSLKMMVTLPQTLQTRRARKTH